jgi:hypothetical protein
VTPPNTRVPQDPREWDPRVLSLSLFDLKSIITQLEKAEHAGVRFTGDLLAGRHRVSVRWESNQLEGDSLVITEIRRVE